MLFKKKKKQTETTTVPHVNYSNSNYVQTSSMSYPTSGREDREDSEKNNYHLRKISQMEIPDPNSIKYELDVNAINKDESIPVEITLYDDKSNSGGNFAMVDSYNIVPNHSTGEPVRLYDIASEITSTLSMWSENLKHDIYDSLSTAVQMANSENPDKSTVYSISNTLSIYNSMRFTFEQTLRNAFISKINASVSQIIIDSFATCRSAMIAKAKSMKLNDVLQLEKLYMGMPCNDKNKSSYVANDMYYYYANEVYYELSRSVTNNANSIDHIINDRRFLNIMTMLSTRCALGFSDRLFDAVTDHVLQRYSGEDAIDVINELMNECEKILSVTLLRLKIVTECFFREYVTLFKEIIDYIGAANNISDTIEREVGRCIYPIHYEPYDM